MKTKRYGRGENTSMTLLPKWDQEKHQCLYGEVDDITTGSCGALGSMC